MPQIQEISLDFKEAMFRAWFMGESVPENLYFGLSSLNIEDMDDVSIEALETFEIDNPSYQRFILIAPQWQIQKVGRSIELSIDTPAFLNTSESLWRAETAFISSTNARGGILIGYSALEFAPRVIAPGDSIQIPVRLIY